MYSLQTTNRFAFLDSEDEHDENVDTTNAQTAKPEGKKGEKKERSASKNIAKNAPNKAVLADKTGGRSENMKTAPVKSNFGDDKPGQQRQGGQSTYQGDNKRPKSGGGGFGTGGGFGSGGGVNSFGTGGGVNSSSFGSGGGVNSHGNQGQGSGKSNFGGGGFGRGGGQDNRGKREFERKSGSDKAGIKATEKRDGGGAHNWGSTAVTDALKAEASNENAVEGAEENKNAAEGEGEAKPEEAPTMSLDDFLKNQKRVESKASIRKANEGEGVCDGKLGKRLPGNVKSTNDEEDVEIYVKGGSGRVKKRLDVTFQPMTSNRGERRDGRGFGRDRGGRGEGRGGPSGSGPGVNRGMYQKPAPNTEVIALQDDSAFPMLGNQAAGKPGKVY